MRFETKFKNQIPNATRYILKAENMRWPHLPLINFVQKEKMVRFQDHT